MVMVLEQHMIDEIAHIGELRRPNEACGLLLPEPHRGRQVWELPNRSLTPHDSFVMKGEDMALALEGYFPEELEPEFVQRITAWHTHPKGNLGPSGEDLRVKPPHMKSLVVTIYEDAPAKATWF